SADQEDISSSAIAEKVTEYEWEELLVDKRIKQAVWWATTCGSGFLKTWWSPNEKDSDGTNGLIHVDALSPFHVLVPDLTEEEIEQQSFVCHSSQKTPEWINRVYGSSVKLDATEAPPAWQERLLRATGIDGSVSARRGLDVKEMWIKSSPDLLAGGRIVWTKDDEPLAIVDYSETGPEYEHAEFPFAKIDHMQSGRFYGDSFIVDLIPAQKDYNASLSQIKENLNLTMRPQWKAREGEFDASRWVNRPGAIVTYRGITGPEPLQQPEMPSMLPQLLDRNVIDLSDAASQHETSRGSAPGRVEAATAISFLQEQDDSAIDWTLTTIEQAVEKVGKHILHYANQFWDAQRTIKVVGSNHAFEAGLFGARDLRGNTDFRVVKGSATPRSHAAKQAFIMELMSTPGPNGAPLIPPERGLALLDMAATDRLYEEMLADQRHADRENLLIAQIPERDPQELQAQVEQMRLLAANAPPANQLSVPEMAMRIAAQNTMPINPYDNDLVHIDRHEIFEKSQDFQRLSPYVQQLHIAHCRMHYQGHALKAGFYIDLADPQLIGFVKGFGEPPLGSNLNEQKMLAMAQQGELPAGPALEGEQGGNSSPSGG
ncbi:MAG: hypothetical protein MN733_32795, partial [Nitrososphaera sp.]|nr:hypothetical protein [Nitrososphaera sp.]